MWLCGVKFHKNAYVESYKIKIIGLKQILMEKLEPFMLNQGTNQNGETVISYYSWYERKKIKYHLKT